MFCSGCSTIRYLFQAGKGQLELANRARPIPEVVADPRTPTRVKDLLSSIDGIKKYGESQGLKATSNYQDYVHLDRYAAVWVVSACEPLQFKSKEWKFPIVGSFPYLGWFDRDNAVEFGKDLKKEGWDVDVRGAAAYSTLGWFRDAVLSTMIPPGDEALGELVNVILHESVHATVYVSGQAFFNESVASFIADRLTADYLKARGAEAEKQLKAYLTSEELSKVRTERFHQAYGELALLYSSDRPTEAKLVEKEKLLTQLRADLKYPREINNATLVQFKTYNDGGADFERLYKACKGDWRGFVGSVLKLKPESFEHPQQSDLKSVIDGLIQSGC